MKTNSAVLRLMASKLKANETMSEDPSKAVTVRLDGSSSVTLDALAKKVGLSRAALAQELLVAAIADANKLVVRLDGASDAGSSKKTGAKDAAD